MYYTVNKQFSFSEKIIIAVILLNVLTVSYIPGISIGGIKIYLLQLLLFFFAAILSLSFNKEINLFERKVDIVFLLRLFIVFFFIISSFIINFEYNFKPLSIAKLLTYPFIIFAFFFYIPKRIYWEKQLFEKIVNLWIYFSIFSALVSFAFIFLGTRSSHEGMSIAFFYYSNIFAFVFTIAIPLLVYKFFTKQLGFILFWLFTLLLTSCLLFTFSRAGYLGVLISTSILMYKKSKTTFIIGIIIAAILISSFFLDFAVSKGEASTYSRFQVMYVAYNMIINNGITRFLWGYGVFNNIAVFQKELTYNFGSYREETGPHNFVITLMIQFGFLVTITLLAFLIRILVKSFYLKNIEHLDDFNQKINLSISIVIGVLIQCMFEDIVVYPEFYVMPLFLIFLGYLYYSISKRNSNLYEKTT